MHGPMEGSVTPHRNSAGVVRYRVRVTIDGARKSLGLYDTEDEARAALTGALEALGPIEPGVTLRAWGERWLHRREIGGQHRAVRKDRSRWRTHIASSAIAGKPLRRILRPDVVKFMRGLLDTDAIDTITTGKGESRETTKRPTARRLSRQTAVHVMNLLRCALRDAADEALMSSNPAADVKVPRNTSGAKDEPWTFLQPFEIASLHAALDGRAVTGTKKRTLTFEAQRAIQIVALYTGLRGGEMWGLHWGDVHLDGPHPHVIVRHSYEEAPKTGRIRRVPLLEHAVEALTRWRKLAPGVARALVFPAEHGGCHAEGYDAGWVATKKAAQIARPVRFYDLRHTCASHLVMGTWTPRPLALIEVKEWLGHTSITTTMRYAHLAPDALARAIRPDVDGHSADTPSNVIAIGHAQKGSETDDE